VAGMCHTFFTRLCYDSTKIAQSQCKDQIVIRRFVFTVLLVAMMVAVTQAQDAPITRIETPPSADDVQLTPVITDGLRRPIYLTNAADGSGRVFIVEQGGVIYVTDSDMSDLGIYLDVSALVSAEANSSGYTERGLLGLAFHPAYASNGTFFINYTDRRGTTVIARYTTSADNPNEADPNSAEIIFTQPQPFPNHNGGHMAFGPDGYLYVSLGDGGSANDPLGAGQSLDVLLGKILRLDVNPETGYAVPADNPFANGGGLPEIWAYGLRNVWRFSFDRATGDLYLGDVGQNKWEEINFQPADSRGGENYGWSAFEGSHVFNQNASATNPVLPIAEFEHSNANGCSITGGFVYRGSNLPTMQGVYLYSDYCSGRIWIAYRDASDTWQSQVFLEAGVAVSSFGEDEAGELYVVGYGGEIYRLDAAQ
jgi:glucose/arabinose dehydrogenase